MKISFNSVVKYSIVFLIGLGLCYYLFKENFQNNFFQILKNSNWSYAILSGIFVLLAHIFRALRWQLMLNPLTKKKTSFLNTFYALMIGYLINLVLPRAGELVRCGLISKKEDINSIAAFGTVIAERIFDMIMLFLIIIVLSFIYSHEIAGILSGLQLDQIISLQKLLLILILLLVIGVLLIFFFRRQKKLPLWSKFLKAIEQLKEGILTSKQIKKPYLFTLYTCLIWLFYVLSSLIGFQIFKETENLNFYSAMFTVVGGSFGMIAPIQGGIGAFHFMVAECLRFLGINLTIGLAYATIIHAAQTLAVIIFGFLSLILGFNFNISLNNEKPQSNHQG